MQRPAFVTVTGVDDGTDLLRLASLSDAFAVEWGVLLSPRRQGVAPRFPSLDTVGRLTAMRHARRLRLSAHLCGGHAKSILRGEGVGDLADALVGNFGRFQVNTADRRAEPRSVRRFAEDMNAAGQGVLQCRDGFPDGDADVDWLFDQSGGFGVTPESWPEPPTGRLPFVGYAGGLGPDTMAGAVAAIGPRHDAWRPYWVDCETNVRTDDRLDLDKVEATLRAAFE